MTRKEDYSNYDSHGKPVLRMNFREILLALGAKEEDGKYTFDTTSPTMDLYPVVLLEDGTGYGVDRSHIYGADWNKDKDSITLFCKRIPEEWERGAMQEVGRR